MPQTFVDQIGAIVLSYGLIGVVALVGWFAVYKLYQRNQELNSALLKTANDAIASQLISGNAMQSLREVVLTQQATLQKLSDLIISGKVNHG